MVRLVDLNRDDTEAATLRMFPAKEGQRIAANVMMKGQLSSPREFGEIMLRANPNGSLVRLRDVAEVELAGQSYIMQTRLNGRPTVGIGI